MFIARDGQKNAPQCTGVGYRYTLVYIVEYNILDTFVY